MTITQRESDTIESHQTFIPPLEGNKTLPLLIAESKKGED